MIELEQISKSYLDAGRERHVLSELDLSLQVGDQVAIRGRSGSGKTTLLNLIAGIDDPSSGKIIINGQELTSLSRKQRTIFRRDHIGIVFQFFNLIPTLTVEENILLPVELAGAVNQQTKIEMDRLLERVDLLDRKNEFPDVLSGGEQQRVAIARSLIRKPEIILADEPTGNLDSKTGRDVIDLLRELISDRNGILLLVTHSRYLAAELQQVFTLEDGRLSNVSGQYAGVGEDASSSS
jgi:putative ABC transport system ATP-binding protein